MRERTRRRWCRAGVVVFCLLPTALVAAASLAWRTPAVRRAWSEWRQARLGRRLGLDVAAARVEWLRPDRTLWRQLTLRDPETGAVLLAADAVQVDRGGEGIVAAAGHADVDWDALASWLRPLHDRLLRADAGPARVALRAETLTVRGAGAVRSFRNAGLVLQSHATGRRMTLACRVADGGAECGPVRLTVLRNRQLHPPATRVQLDTGGVGLPARWIAAWLAGARCLDEDCAFQGQLAATSGRRGWRIEAAGRLSPLQLDRLVTDHFPHKLSGRAVLTLRAATAEAGELTSAAGELTAESGVISRSLLLAAAEHLGAACPERVRRAPQPLLPYARLALAWRLDRGRLRVTGRCLDSEADVWLMDAQGPLLRRATDEPIPTVALLRTLAPDSEWLAPACRETALLARLLPLPEARVRVDYRPLRLVEP